VHQAPAFGEEDYRICLENKIITEDGFLPCPVDEQGRFTQEVADFAGIYVKVRVIIKYKPRMMKIITI
jgi:isoleucyl-tRNA synthetase